MTASERALEERLVENLQSLKYAVREDIRDRAAMEANFRQHFESLNRCELTDPEFARLLEELVTADVFASARRLRQTNTFVRDDGTPLHYTLVNTRDWCKNTFEAVRQLKVNTAYSHHRYDVVLLMNGVPVAQVELKTLGVNPKKAMEQIVAYKTDPGNGYTNTLLCFVQLFVVSNWNETFYFANNDARHFAFDADERHLPVYQFAEPDNRKVAHLEEFAEKFLAKCALAETIGRHIVLVESEQRLLMMRPYQVYAVQAIVDCIRQDAGHGYVWHTTGSGKTLTSFKASTLLADDPTIEKILFVVDRKDLDRQTREEFNRFQPGCVEENTNTAALVQRLESTDRADKVIVTTIQKLALALDPANARNYAGRLEPLKDKRMAIIFDECHRSQFGENHQAIRQFFPLAQLFGFTGTPIFEQNASARKVTGEEQTLKTTQDLFEKELHQYTITHAIEDSNVLRFHVDYYRPEGADVRPGTTLAKMAIVEAVLDRHDAATGGRRFNALLATASINDAIAYFRLFREIQAERQAADPEFRLLNIAAVFSPPGDVSADVRQLQEDLAQEREDNRVDPEGKKQALREIIEEYNERFGTDHRVEEFDAYFQDVQKRIKDQQWPSSDVPPEQKIDVTIVVDMLLTGFDSKYLNTLYVDKNLRHHGLIQAFSRTNRVLNATKPFGHIIDFRGQQEAVDEAVALFSGVSQERAREIWLVEKAPVVIEKLAKAKEVLDEFMRSQGLEARPDEVANLKGDEARAGFVRAFKEVQRLATQLDQYTDLTDEQRAQIERALPTDERRGYKGAYLKTVERLREQDRAPGAGPADEQLDFELVLFASATIDYDYIMKLIARYTGQDPKRMKLGRDELVGLIASDAKFLDERETISEYVATLEVGRAMDEREVREGYTAFKAGREAEELAQIAERHGLAPEALKAFVEETLGRRVFDANRLTELFAPLGLGWQERVRRELALMDDLEPVLKRRAGGREVSGLRVYEERARYREKSEEEADAG